MSAADLQPSELSRFLRIGGLEDVGAIEFLKVGISHRVPHELAGTAAEALVMRRLSEL